jgi:IclR family acetate operon transcriptional repressor
MNTVDSHLNGTSAAAGGTRIQSVTRACQLLLWVADRPGGATAKEIAFANRLTLSTTYHLLNTLVDQGMLAKDEQRRYVLGPSSALVAQAYVRGAPVPRNLLNAIRELAEVSREQVWLADWGDLEIRVLASVDGREPSPVTQMIGRPYADGHARAGGKLLLAYAAPHAREEYIRRYPLRRRTSATICDSDLLDEELARIRDRAYAYDEQEFAPGVSCIAAPLVEDGRIVASIAIATDTERFDREREPLTAAVVGVVDGIHQGRFDSAAADDFEFDFTTI